MERKRTGKEEGKTGNISPYLTYLPNLCTNIRQKVHFKIERPLTIYHRINILLGVYVHSINIDCTSLWCWTNRRWFWHVKNTLHFSATFIFTNSNSSSVATKKQFLIEGRWWWNVGVEKRVCTLIKWIELHEHTRSSKSFITTKFVDNCCSPLPNTTTLPF